MFPPRERRPARKGTCPARLGTLFLPLGTCPQRQGTRFLPLGTRPRRLGTRFPPLGTCPQRLGTPFLPLGTRPQRQGTRPQPRGTRPFWQGTRPFSQGTRLPPRRREPAGGNRPFPGWKHVELKPSSSELPFHRRRPPLRRTPETPVLQAIRPHRPQSFNKVKKSLGPTFHRSAAVSRNAGSAAVITNPLRLVCDPAALRARRNETAARPLLPAGHNTRPMPQKYLRMARQHTVGTRKQSEPDPARTAEDVAPGFQRPPTCRLLRCSARLSSPRGWLF